MLWFSSRGNTGPYPSLHNGVPTSSLLYMVPGSRLYGWQFPVHAMDRGKQASDLHTHVK